MDVVLLRTLTRKSILNFGRHAPIPIGDLVDLQKVNYLRWIYYNYEGLTFTEDILTDINILPEHRIKKPGKDPELHLKTQNEKMKFIKEYYPVNYKRLMAIKKKGRNESSKRKYSMNKIYSTKSVLQSKNQGH